MYTILAGTQSVEQTEAWFLLLLLEVTKYSSLHFYSSSVTVVYPAYIVAGPVHSYRVSLKPYL